MELFCGDFKCQSISFLTKHLCGNGTDLALRFVK